MGLGLLRQEIFCNKEFLVMPLWVRAAGKWGSILVVIALIITLLKQLIAFIGFITVAVKFLIILVFVAVIVGVGFLILKGLNDSRRKKD
jgi:hypothetical protein